MSPASALRPYPPRVAGRIRRGIGEGGYPSNLESRHVRGGPPAAFPNLPEQALLVAAYRPEPVSFDGKWFLIASVRQGQND